MTGRSRATAAERLIGPVYQAATVFLTTDRKKLGETLHRIDLEDGSARFFPDGLVKFDDSGRRVGAELCIVPWQNGRPVAVHPESIAVLKAVWPKMS